MPLAEDDDMVKTFPTGSSQSPVPYDHSAMAIAARWADHECPWREAAV